MFPDSCVSTKQCDCQMTASCVRSRRTALRSDRAPGPLGRWRCWRPLQLPPPQPPHPFRASSLVTCPRDLKSLGPQRGQEIHRCPCGHCPSPVHSPTRHPEQPGLSRRPGGHTLAPSPGRCQSWCLSGSCPEVGPGFRCSG